MVLFKTLSNHYPNRLSIGEIAIENDANSRYRLDVKWLELNNCLEVIEAFCKLGTGISRSNAMHNSSDKMKRVKKYFQVFSIKSIRK